ncbi:MAG TPA: hypothetical protein VLV48_09915 [Thermoanaerobaculia bacterium]|nr:hypothetical protein [Thermoanaerobaculia bacterium]
MTNPPVLRRIAPLLADYFRDLLVIAGVMLIARGTFLFSVPLGYVVLGALLLAIGIVGVLRSPGTTRE